MPSQRRSVVSGGNSSNQQQSRRAAVNEEYDEAPEEEEGYHVDAEDGTEEEDYEEEQEVLMMDVDDEDEDEGEDEDTDLALYGLEDDDDESDGIPELEDLPEWTNVDLPYVEKNFLCGICLGILRKTRTFMGCLHRFCRECIDKSMRQGQNECPSCRTHCPSRRSLRDDSTFDNIILTVFKDIDKYEAEDRLLREQVKARNMQIQATIEQIHRRQSDAVNEEQNNNGKDSAGKSAQRSSQRQQNACGGGRGHSKRSVNQTDEIEQDQINQNGHEHDQINHNQHKQDQVNQHEHEDDRNNQDDEIMAEIMRRRSQRRTRVSIASSPATNLDGDCIIRDTSPGVVLKSGTLSWGSAAARSHTRYGSSSGSRRIKTTRSTKLFNHLCRAKEEENEFEVQLKLVSYDKLRVEDLEKPNIFCSPLLSVDHLREYVARDTPLRMRDIELLLVKEAYIDPEKASTSRINCTSLSRDLGYSKIDLLPLEGSETLADLYARCPSKKGKLIIAYRQKNES